MSTSALPESELDENLQSRQLAVYGRQAMGKLSRAHVLITGLTGLGAEVAKNVSLANVRHITLHDPRPVELRDLSSQFFATPEDVAASRTKAEACLHHVQELNPSVSVDVLSSAQVSAHDIADKKITVLVAVDCPRDEAVRLNELCRTAGRSVAFLWTTVNGVFGRAFADFGEEFVVQDVNGEEIKTAIIKHVSKAENGVVTCVSDEHIDFEEGDHVTFTEIRGMTQLNNIPPIPVKDVRPFSFAIGDTSSYDEYISGGIVQQVKMPKTLRFKSLEQGLKEPGEFLMSDFAKFGRSELLHAAYQGLDDFHKENGRYPQAYNAQDIDSALKLARKYASEDFSGPDAKVVTALINGSQYSLNPMAAIFGGFVGQEVIKAATGKFHPLFQWLYIDAVEALPEEPLSSEETQVTPELARYESQVVLFGKTLQQKLMNLKYFMVGAGALGCEFLKNFALMGLACGPEGSLTVTDDDTIEKSNLTRQFLFRNWMIGQSKSAAAAKVVQGINPNIQIRPMQDRVSTETEAVFNDDFWYGLDGVCNALDNIKARLYVDAKCVFYEKPLLESGTLGTKCNTQMVIPHLTENYGASTDPPEKVTPDCTLHNFPHNIQHCLSWARSDFIGSFETVPADVNSYLESGKDFVTQLQSSGASSREVVEKLTTVKGALSEGCATFADCVRWARLKFEEVFVNRIKQLTFTFPADAKTASGQSFWSPPKRFPVPVRFDAEDPLHIQFIVAGANLRAFAGSIPVPQENRDVGYIRSILGDIIVPEFIPKEGLKIQTEPEKEGGSAGASSSSGGSNDATEIEGLLQQIPKGDFVKYSPTTFEKDDDTNFHMDYISAVGNLRARNYEIKEVDQLQAKLIAGRIIPAIATTTAMATGFVCIELFKILQKKPLEAYRNVNSNLALPLFAFFEPNPPGKVKTRVEKKVPDPLNNPEYVEEENIVAYPEGHTAWDKLHIRLPEGANATLKQVIEHIKATHKITVSGVTMNTPGGGGVMLYNEYMKNTHANLPQTMGALYEKYFKKPASSVKYFLPAMIFVNDDGDFVETPNTIYHFE